MMQVKEFRIQPYKGIDIVFEDGTLKELRLGMTREQARSVFDEEPKSFKKGRNDEMETDSYYESCVFLYYRKPGYLTAIELTDVDVILRDVNLLKEPYSKVLDFCKRIDSSLKITTASGFDSGLLGIGVWAPYAEEEGSDYVAESVLVGEQEYLSK